jgi:hypothetical protein
MSANFSVVRAPKGACARGQRAHYKKPEKTQLIKKLGFLFLVRMTM